MTAIETLIQFCVNNEIDHAQVDEDTVLTTFVGTQRKSMSVVFVAGQHYFRAESFVARNPDENHEMVYRWLLEQNITLVLARYGVDQFGDIYLSASVPIASVDDALVDQLLGVIVSNADSSFNTLIELGFRNAIEREWAWRTSRGLNADNLAAFSHLFETD
jgi:hypothetical protein